MTDRTRLQKRDRRLVYGAIGCAVFAVALVSVGTYRVSSAPGTARPAIRAAVTPAVSTSATADILPIGISPDYALFPWADRYGPAYPGFVPYSQGPALRVDTPALDLQSLLPANAGATATGTLAAPPALSDLTSKFESPVVISTPPLPESPAAVRPRGELPGALNPAIPALPAAPSLIRR